MFALLVGYDVVDMYCDVSISTIIIICTTCTVLLLMYVCRILYNVLHIICKIKVDQWYWTHKKFCMKSSCSC